MKAAQLLIAGLIITLASVASATPSCNHTKNLGRFAVTKAEKVQTPASSSSAVSKTAVK